MSQGSMESDRLDLLVDPDIKAAWRAIHEGNKNSAGNTKMIQNSNIISCSISLLGPRLMTRLDLPLRTKNCNGHVRCFGMVEILRTVFKDARPKACLVSTCKAPFGSFKDDIIIDRGVQNILENTRKDCDMVKYYYNEEFYYCKDPFEEDLDVISRTKLDEIIRYISTRYDYPLSDLIRKNIEKIESLHPFKLIDAVSLRRINIPCRFTVCTHLEVFDLIPFLHKSHKGGEPKEYECPVCNKTIDKSNLLTEIRLDHNVFEYLRRRPYDILEAVISKESQDIEPRDKPSKYLELELKIINHKNPEGGFKYAKNYEEFLALYKEPKTLKSVIDPEFEKLNIIDKSKKSIEFSVKDAISGETLIIPMRTTKCKHLETCDAKTYAIAATKAAVAGESTMKCPYPNCDAEVDPDDFQDELYVDAFLMRASLLGYPTVTYLPAIDEFHNPQKESIIMEEIKNNKIDALGFKKGKRSINLICELSKKRMKIPVVSTRCGHHACMDLEAYMKEKPKKCCKPDCRESLNNSDMGVDVLIEKLLKRNPRHDEFDYDKSKDKIIPDCVEDAEENKSDGIM